MFVLNRYGRQILDDDVSYRGTSLGSGVPAGALAAGLKEGLTLGCRGKVQRVQWGFCTLFGQFNGDGDIENPIPEERCR